MGWKHVLKCYSGSDMAVLGHARSGRLCSKICPPRRKLKRKAKVAGTQSSMTVSLRQKSMTITSQDTR